MLTDPMNTAGWEFNEELSEETHLESRTNEFLGYCLDRIRSYHKLFPEHVPAFPLANAVATLMSCKQHCDLLANVIETPEGTASTIFDFVMDWGWAHTLQTIAIAAREYEREQVAR